MIVVAALLVSALILLGNPSEPDQTENGPVLVELFTSQGCSSCPPADLLLSEIASDPDLADRVVALAYHVDYWNRLGWADPFSSASHSDRQRAYAAALREDRIYTPQLVINGEHHVVGSNRHDVMEAIERELGEPSQCSIAVSLSDTGNLIEVTTSWRLHESLLGKTELSLALFENGLDTEVSRGENRGRSLINDRVVRKLTDATTIANDRTGSHTHRIGLQPSWTRANLGVAAIVQQSESRKVLCASSAHIE